MSIDSVRPSNHPILHHPLLLLPSIFASIRVFSSGSVLWIRWPKYWSFNFSISPSKEYSGLISFRMNWLDLLAVQRTLKSFLQNHSSKASILQCSAFFIVQLSHPYMTTGKTIALTRKTFVGKVMSLLFNMLSRLVIAFLPRSKRLLFLFIYFFDLFFLVFLILFFNFTILYWFCHIFKWIRHRYTFHSCSHYLQWFWRPHQKKSVTISIVFPSICHEVMGADAMIFIFWILSFKPAFSHSTFTFIKRLFSSSSLSASLSAIRMFSSAYLGYWYFSQQSWFHLVLHPAQHFAWCILHIS